MAGHWLDGPRWNNGPETLADIPQFAADADLGDGEYRAGAAPFATLSNHIRNKNRPAVRRYQRSALYNLIHVGAFIVTGMLSPELIPTPEEQTRFESLMRRQILSDEGEGVYDRYRLGCTLHECAFDPWVEGVLERVDDVLHSLNIVSKSHHSHPTGLTVLKTLRFSKPQKFHSDYERGGAFLRSNKPRRGEEDDQPCAPWAISVLMAMSKDGADLDLPCGRLHIDQYDAIIFAGDLRHAGSAYKKENLRLHVYYDYDDGKWTKKIHPDDKLRETYFWSGVDERDAKTRGWADDGPAPA